MRSFRMGEPVSEDGGDGVRRVRMVVAEGKVIELVLLLMLIIESLSCPLSHLRSLTHDQ